MNYSDQRRIDEMLRYAAKLNRFITSRYITTDEIANNEDWQWYVTPPLSVIGEHARKISDVFKEALIK